MDTDIDADAHIESPKDRRWADKLGPPLDGPRQHQTSSGIRQL